MALSVGTFTDPASYILEVSGRKFEGITRTYAVNTAQERTKS